MYSLTGYLRNLAERDVYDFEDIIEKYEAWVLDHRYMVMSHLREARKRGYDDRMDCMREDISVSKRNLAECEARVSSFDYLERGSETREGGASLNLSIYCHILRKFSDGLKFNVRKKK
jgi:hypothetical protein